MFIDMSKQTKRNQSFENENNKKIIKKDQNLLLIYQNHFQIQQIFLNKTRPLTVIIKRKSLEKYNLSKKNRKWKNITITSLEDSYDKIIYIK